MAEEGKYRNYTAEDIEKYHKGLLSPKEMNELERAALDDPFLADALEGYGAVSVNAASDLSYLKNKLQERVGSSKVVSMTQGRNSFKWWRVAAAVMILGGLGYLTFFLFTNNENKEVAKVESKKQVVNQPQPSTIPTDSGAIKATERTAPVKELETSNDQKDADIKATPSNEKKSAPVSNPVAGKTSDKNFVASESQPAPSVPLSNKSEKYDSTEAPRAVVNSNDAFAKSKAPTQQARQSEGVATMQQKEIGVRDQQNANSFRGRVVDANNNPLPFANITNTKDNVGTYSDARGNFTLISPDSTLDVQVRSIGFESNVARLKNNVPSNQVVLQEDKTGPVTIAGYKKTDSARVARVKVTLEEPEPADGWSNYDVYLANNMNLSADVKKKNLNGREVQLSFRVNQDGSPVDIRVEKSLCRECDEEAIRVVREGPRWKYKNKKTKRVKINIPFDTKD